MSDFHYTKDQDRELLGIVEPGRYFVEIKRAEAKHSKNSGEPMIEIQLNEVGSGRAIATDYWMLGGKGYGMGKRRLQIIGAIPKEADEWSLDAASLVGVRCFVHTKIEVFEGRQSVKVDIKNGELGYEAASQSVEDEAGLSSHGAVPF